MLPFCTIPLLTQQWMICTEEWQVHCVRVLTRSMRDQPVTCSQICMHKSLWHLKQNSQCKTLQIIYPITTAAIFISLPPSSDLKMEASFCIPSQTPFLKGLLFIALRLFCYGLLQLPSTFCPLPSDPSSSASIACTAFPLSRWSCPCFHLLGLCLLPKTCFNKHFGDLPGTWDWSSMACLNPTPKTSILGQEEPPSAS